MRSKKVVFSAACGNKGRDCAIAGKPVLPSRLVSPLEEELKQATEGDTKD